jgi:hypothetical protein
MCGRAFSEYDLHRHTSTGPRRSLLGWLLDLWRPRVQEAEVVPFPPAAASRAAQEADHRGAKAA